MGLREEYLKRSLMQGLENVKSVGGAIGRGVDTATNWLDDKTGYNQIPPETRAKLQEAQDMAINYSPMGMGTIIGKSAKGWAQAEGKFSNMLDRQPRAEISDVGSVVKDVDFPLQSFNTPKSNIKLSDVYDGPILKQYPELADMPITIDTDLKYNGYFSDGRGLTNKGITIKGDFIQGKDIPGTKGWETEPARVKINKDKLETILHEIQHSIQREEGFSRGGSPAIFASKNYTLQKRVTDLNNELSITSDVMDSVRNSRNPEHIAKFKELENKYIDLISKRSELAKQYSQDPIE